MSFLKCIFESITLEDAWEQRKFSEILAKSDGLRRGPFGSALKKSFSFLAVNTLCMNKIMLFTILGKQDISLRQRNFKNYTNFN